jgi:ribosomal-protein-alanine N-acetyltransferase
VSWSIERMQPERDLDELVALEQATFTNAWSREMFTWELENSDVSHVYVVRCEGRLAAFCSVWIIFDELHVNNVAVAPSLRGRGIATALLRHVFTDAVGLGASRATLEVRRSNTAALKLYERLGFELGGIRPRYYRNPEEDAMILWKHDLGAMPENC